MFKMIGAGVALFMLARVWEMDMMRSNDLKGGLMVDYWQVLGSVAALIFSVGFIDQLRVTWMSKNVDGISLFQWCVFTLASGIFTAFYVHLSQWLMVVVSLLSTVCCFLIVLMIIKYRKTHITS